MALIKCNECSKDISSNAISCPHCGNVLEKKIEVSDRTYKTVFENRNFEISLLWKRSNAFWLFTAAAFAGLFVVYKDNHFTLSIIVANIGFICTFCWTLANRGSKFWQEFWEKETAEMEPEYFSGEKDNVKRTFYTQRFSVSKTLIICSDYLTIIWFLIISGILLKYFICPCIHYSNIWAIIITVATLLYAIYVFIFAARGED